MVLSMDGYPPGAAVGGRRIPAGAPPSQCGKRNADLSAGSVAECGIEGSALVSGWLFDLYPAKGGMVLWVVDEAGGEAPPPAPYRRLHRGHLLRLRPAAGPAVQPPPQGLPPGPRHGRARW